MNTQVKWMTVLFVGLFLLGCGPAQSQETAHWGYEGEEGPAHWAELDPAFALCGSGQAQSPIDVGQTAGSDLVNLEFDYGQTPLMVLNNGHTIQVNHAEGSQMTVDGESYALRQFHFHTPSEHTIDGQHFPVELHLVHQNEAGELAVVGIMIAEGAESAALAEAWAHLLTAVSEPTTVAEVTIDPNALLPADQRTYRYAGSLTTPPCSEQVRWHLFTTPITMSASQISDLETILGENNRPVQPLHERDVIADTSAP